MSQAVTLAAMGKGPDTSHAPRILNRKARHEYHIVETLEVGIVLRGTEVKSIRQGQCSIAEAFAAVDPKTNELWIHQMDIGPYSHAPADRQHAPKDKRKLLAKRRQIERLYGLTTSKGTTLIPLSLYFNERGIVKVELAVCEGKRKGDKREKLRDKESRKTIQKAMARKTLR
jgi:SsrA-binding protein